MEDFPSSDVVDESTKSGSAEPDDWVMHTDPQGKKYFYSATRKKSIWADERPDIKPKDDVEIHKTSDGRSYSYSKRLRQSFWVTGGATNMALPTTALPANAALPSGGPANRSASQPNMGVAPSPRGRPGPRSFSAAENDHPLGIAAASVAAGGGADRLDKVADDSLEGEAKDSLEAWRHHRDPKSGKVYYYNKITGASSWTKPEQWSEHLDPFTGKVFYRCARGDASKSNGVRLQEQRPHNAIVVSERSVHRAAAGYNWHDELEQVLRLPVVESQLSQLMRHWPVPKVVHWAQHWKPEKLETVFKRWPPKRIAKLFNSPELDLPAVCHCCKVWDLMDVAQILKHTSDNVSSKIITELYDEEEVWDDDTVSEVLEQLEVSKIGNFLLQYEAEDAAGILRHWSKSFIQQIVDQCDPEWRKEVLHWLDEMNAEHLWSAALAKASSTGSLTGDGDDHMQRMWSRLDVDNSGFLDMDEIKELLSVAGVPVESAAEVLLLADDDGDGKVTFDEFTKLMRMLKKSQRRRQERRKGQRAEHKWMEAIAELSVRILPGQAPTWDTTSLRQVWALFDTDNSGSIDAEELHNAMAKVGINLDPSQLTEVVRRVDGNQDGQISFEEFSGFVKAIAARQTRRRRLSTGGLDDDLDIA